MNVVRIIYLSFDVDTYAPVTPESIESDATCRIEISRGEYVGQSLAHLFEDVGPGAFSSKVVRMKISGLTEGVIFVDTEGGVLLSDSGVERQLSATSFTHLKALMESLAGPRRCNP